MANGNVIYLPPGVAAPAPTQQQVAMPTGIPFDRNFFQAILPQAIASFCSQTKCDIPRVELLTVDGVTHYVSGIIGVHDAWVALQIAKEEHRHPVEVFIPYNTIFRVEVHQESERRRHIGFIQNPDPARDQVVLVEPPQPVIEAPAEAPGEAPVAAPAVTTDELKTVAARRPSTRKKPAT